MKKIWHTASQKNKKESLIFPAHRTNYKSSQNRSLKNSFAVVAPYRLTATNFLCCTDTFFMSGTVYTAIVPGAGFLIANNRVSIIW